MAEEASLRVTMMPRDTNVHGTIFGGIILSYIDQAGAVHARRIGCANVVTVAMDGVIFHQPVYVGDIVDFFTETVRIGRTSVTVKVWVEAERWGSPPAAPGATGHGERVKVTEAEVVVVAVDAEGRCVPVRPDGG